MSDADIQATLQEVDNELEFRPLSAQEEVNLEKEEQEEYERLILSNKEEELTSEQDSPSTVTEQSPSTTTPINEQQTQSESPVNLEALENLMSTLPPEVSQILAMAIPQLDSESNLLDLVELMNSQMDGEISDSVLEDLETLFE